MEFVVVTGISGGGKSTALKMFEDAFVVGGGVSKAGKYLTDKVEEEYRAHAFHAHANAKFLPAKLGNDAGMYGSVKMVIG